MITASLIFIVTLLFIIIQPKNIQIGTSAIIGATFALIFKVVSFDDVLEVINIVWDATFAFIGIIILSLVLDKIGFFEYMALRMAKFSRGNGHLMFVYSMLLGSFVSAFFANDGAALILTPIILAKMKILQLRVKTMVVFLLASGFISDSASLPFVFSNLTNIITANYFDITFMKYFFDMLVPFFVSITISTLVLWLYLRKDIPKEVDIKLLKEPKSAIKNQKLFYFSWIFLAFLLGTYFLSDIYKIPISFFALGGAIIFLLIASFLKEVNIKSIIKESPWQIVWFSIGLYIVVYGLKNVGLTDEVAIVLEYLVSKGDTLAVLGTGFIAAFLSAIMNNLPTVMIMDIALKDIGSSAMIYANIIGCNLGPKMTPFGSLATLLWLYVLNQKGVKISFWEYSKFGLVVTPLVLFVVLLSL
ncbi:arsenical pump membrane protein [Aliarcobacter faecis]|uniref:arsenic transporter n=1 Tax=Aliarcobacter faecis TaxID=1564138 RepID=UPI00047A40CB|nr:arsenic transporter [Aliarcobacter faecis]QKF74219.1 arsenical pump membrane protein [Aliarcobacter faecis]